MSVLERCPSYRESNKRSKERQGPTLGVRLIEVSVKRESTVFELALKCVNLHTGLYKEPSWGQYYLMFRFAGRSRLLLLRILRG